MIINGKDIGFVYTIGVHCDYSDYVVAHEDVSTNTAEVEKAVMMNKAYCQIYGGEPITADEIRALPYSDFTELLLEIRAVEKRDSTRQVESVEKKQVAAKGAKK